MKVLILSGGYGTRLSEETTVKPKPMIEIGEYPILWHIMKIYSEYGFNDFIVLLGYKGYMIKEYFANYLLHQSNVTIDLASNKLEIHNTLCEPWKVTLLDTGQDTMTGGRIKRAQEYVGNHSFMVTYGDGVGDINIGELVEFHKAKGKLATLTAVQPLGRFGALKVDEQDSVLQFEEKPKGDNTWINGGFYVFEPEVFDYIENDTTVLEQDSLVDLSKNSQLVSYKHDGFWRPMDTLRDKRDLERVWGTGNAPWKIW